ncbi:MAG: glycosyltransferase family 4 protein, partial [Chloroflexi bacterium]|nr:glycosyltransferase family 4 protein [Chloroflexota bacterium]
MRVGINASFWHRQDTGSGQYLRQLHAALRRLAPDVELTLYTPRSGAAAMAEVTPLATPLERVSDNLAKLWFEQVSYPRACRRHQVDLLHVPYFAPPACASAPLVVTVHDLIPLILPAYRGSALVRGYTRAMGGTAQRADLVLTDSLASARDITRLLAIPLERVLVVYLAADTNYRPLPPTECAPVLERLGIRPPYVLYLGGFDVRKNLASLLSAWARARGALGDARLVIAGRLPATDSAFAPHPRRLSAQRGLGDDVCFTGWVDEADKPALYSAARAFAFPSQYEGFGLPVLEAISCGTPAIVGAGSSLEEIAGPGGLVVDPG